MGNTQPQLILDDLRRLTGPSLLWDKPGSIIDVLVTGLPLEQVVATWREQVRQLLDAVGWQDETSCSRVFAGGASLAISGPIDALYASCDINEVAWQRTCLQLSGEQLPNFESAVKELSQTIAAERNPNLVALQHAAAEHGAAFLWDDDLVSIGHGKGADATRSQCQIRHGLPAGLAEPFWRQPGAGYRCVQCRSTRG